MRLNPVTMPAARNHGYGFKSYSLRKLEEAITAYNAVVHRNNKELEDERAVLIQAWDPEKARNEALATLLERFGQWKENNPKEYANRGGKLVEEDIRSAFKAYLSENGVVVEGEHAPHEQLANSRWWYLASAGPLRTSVPKITLTREKLFPGDGGRGAPYVAGQNKIGGDFKPLLPSVEKYGGERVYRYQFVGKKKALEALRVAYREVRGEPGFMHVAHHLDRHPERYEEPRLANYVEFPQLYVSGPGFTLGPHTTYNDLQGLGRDPLTAKHRDGGISYLIWFTHPSLLKDAVNHFTPETYQQTAQLFREQKLGRTNSFYRPGRERAPVQPHKLQRTASQRTIGEIEKESRQRYLASILDFTVEDLPYLRELRSVAIQHMKRVHGYDEAEDSLRLYFHFPYDEHTTTMHLHVRLNQGRVGLEETKSFYLDSIIDYLSSARGRGDNNIYGLILEREQQAIYWPRKLEIVEGINTKETKLVLMTECDNPFVAK